MQKENISAENKTEQEKKHGCIWHYVLCIIMPFAALWNIFTGILSVTGFKHELNSYIGNTIMFPEMVYGEFPPLKVLDLVFGITVFCMAVFQIIIFVLLLKRFRSAVLFLNIMICMMCASCALYDMFFTAFVKAANKPIYGEMVLKSSLYYESAVTTGITAVVIAVVLCICNRVYYKKRRTKGSKKLF